MEDRDTCEDRGVCTRHECYCPCAPCDERGVHSRAYCYDGGVGDCERCGEIYSDAADEMGYPHIGTTPEAWPHSPCSSELEN